MIVPRFAPSVGARDLAAVVRHRKDGAETVHAFESAFAARVGRRFAFAVPSARAGLFHLLATCGRPGARAALPALTYYAVPDAARLAGYAPRFVDVRTDTLLMDEAALSALPGDVGVVIPTHLYGRVQDMDAVSEVARARGWLVIEDAAQGLGAAWRGRPAGSMGDAAFFTFGPTKNFTTLGGAMIALDDEAWAARLRDALAKIPPASPGTVNRRAAFAAAMAAAADPLVFGASLYPALRLLAPRGVDVVERLNADPPRAMDGVPDGFGRDNISGAQAALGLRQLETLPVFNERRRENGERLLGMLRGAPGLTIPEPRDGEASVYMSFPILAPDPDEFALRLRRRGVDTARGFMSACAELPMFEKFKTHAPVARRVADQILHLPVHPNLSPADVSAVARAVLACATAIADNRPA